MAIANAYLQIQVQYRYSLVGLVVYHSKASYGSLRNKSTVLALYKYRYITYTGTE